jgi:hypothetical protein
VAALRESADAAARAGAAATAPQALARDATAPTQTCASRTVTKLARGKPAPPRGKKKGAPRSGHRVAWSLAEDRELRNGIARHGKSAWVRILDEGGHVWHEKHRDAHPRGSSLRDRARTLGLL